jgi:RNA polymerase sigma-70 factor (ECF subfamily)
VEEEALGLIGDERVRDLLAQLSPDQREVLLLRVLGGFSVAETASIIGKKPGSVKVIQHRGLQAMRRRVEQRV